MWEILAEIVGAVIIDLLPDKWMPRLRPKDLLPSLAAGRDISFPGWALGTTMYCRRPSGFLVVTPSGFYCCEMPSLPPTRRDIPVERLRVVCTRPGTRADATFMPDDWWVTECLDGDTRVLLACHRHDVRYVEHALSIRVDRITDRT